ncbi:phosphatase PAP2 family protein [Pseudomonas stutzeri]|uniref:phosphatase PAP2 family protein n=2 Tax=Stutzerimonas TaxID=2901164 RepID=UPI000E95B0D8|nr:phosphatase PAP2 family protein [Stutzerimonas nitrititolerans]MBK3867361.1 phosphatase PAP2 family protein [Stutzerimonas stutzeri]HBB79236.1 phosphoesterase [Pseudomonas sp.]HBC00606.1 phosphoesterase [Pseudomonas sp.]HCL75946.1 phosphoesterase [Pseudomonas sp.]
MSCSTSKCSRPFNFHVGMGIPLALMLLLLVNDPTRIDFAIANFFYSPETGFIGRHSWFLEDVLHDRAKQAVITIGVLAILGFGLSLLPTKLKVWRRSLGYLVLALALATSIVTPLKALTAVHCPWSLSEFGGSETYTPLLSEREPTLKPGRCWPGGHASAGFSLIALYFFLRDRRPRAAAWALGLALGLGTVFSIGRMMQGAHFLSHNLWTLLFDWVICLATYRLVLYRPKVKTAGAEIPDSRATQGLVE